MRDLKDIRREPEPKLLAGCALAAIFSGALQFSIVPDGTAREVPPSGLIKVANASSVDGSPGTTLFQTSELVGGFFVAAGGLMLLNAARSKIAQDKTPSVPEIPSSRYRGRGPHIE